ncbi:MAG: geranylgeranyl reductase family protein [Candidatus Heimdallarchaeaceae archaeon]
MTDLYDVVIVGAGPAGVSAAIYCANAGYSVLLIDKKPKDKIGDKVCGEALSKRTVLNVSQALKISPPTEEEINCEVKKLVLQTEFDSKKIVFPAPGYMIDRHKYGQRLLSEALQRDVVLKDNSKVLKAIIQENKVVGVISRNLLSKKEEAYYGKIIIDASGVQAVIRRSIPAELEPKLYNRLLPEDYASCYREIIELSKPHNLDGEIILQYEETIPEPGYMWFFADGPTKLNCGTGFVKIGEDAKKSVKKVYIEAMSKYYPLGTYSVVDGRGGAVPVKPPIWNAVAPGLIVAGDSAFHANPLTAEGHGPALIAGTLAGEIAIKAIKLQRYDLEVLWEYNVKIMQTFGHEHMQDRILALILKKIKADNLRFLLRRKVITQNDLTAAGITEKQTLKKTLKRVIGGFPKFGLLLKMYNAMQAYKKLGILGKNFPKHPKGYEEWIKKVDKIYKKFI